MYRLCLSQRNLLNVQSLIGKVGSFLEPQALLNYGSASRAAEDVLWKVVLE